MIKKMAWNTFKNTGDVNSYLEFKQVQNIEEQISKTKNLNTNNTQQMEAPNGNNKNERYNNF